VLAVCDSFPEAVGQPLINWGHDYGGLVHLDDSFYPWELRYDINRPFGERWTADLHAADEVAAILADEPQPAPGGDLLFLSSAADPFDSLPVEICSAIAMLLPTSDALNARLASRSFWHLFGSQQFWLSRFRRDADRPWLFEARRPGAVRDYRWLYRLTAPGRLSPGLRKRKRVWDLVQLLVPLLELRFDEYPTELPPPWKVPSDPKCDWALAGVDREEASRWLSLMRMRCCRLRSQQVAIPDGLTRVSASTVRVGNSTYLAGIALTTAAGEVLRLGYRGASEQSVEASGLTGFNVAVGSAGVSIHAIQCIDESGQPSPWLGCSDGAPKTERLALGTRLAALEVAFDVGTPCMPVLV
jgi:hypothetical protein